MSAVTGSQLMLELDWTDATVQLVVTTLGVFLALALQAALESKRAEKANHRRGERRGQLFKILEDDVLRLTQSAIRALSFDGQQGQKWVPGARMQALREATELPKWELVKVELLALEPEYESLERFAGFYAQLERLHQGTIGAEHAGIDAEAFAKITVLRFQLADLVVEGIFALKKSPEEGVQQTAKALQAALDAAIQPGKDP